MALPAIFQSIKDNKLPIVKDIEKPWFQKVRMPLTMWQMSSQILNNGYKRCELNENGEKTGKALGKHVINLYSTGISWVVKIRDVQKLQQDIENDPIIKDQMADLGCLLVCTFGNFLAPVLVAVHTVNNLDLGHEPCYEKEGYESDLKKASFLCLLHRHKNNSLPCINLYVVS